ncbi:MAG: DUF4296 domain-containing protein [Bacteroidota bacterium]|nr:DUF4296 domain-containing protein [Bacteroidota bacterium]
MLILPNKFFSHLIFLLGCMLLLSSCNGRPDGVLSQRKMANVLTEMHKTDATMNESGLTGSHYNTKAPYYKYIFKKYGITQAQFDSSLVWYTKNPREFSDIYDKVLANLTSLQKDIKNGKYHPVDTLDLSKMRINLWNKRTRYVLTEDSARTQLHFEFDGNFLMYKDVYVLRFLQRIAPEDSCKRPRVVFRISYVNGKTDSVYRTAFNDSLLRRYTVRFQAFRKLKIKSISGELLASKMYRGKLNARIDSISLFREFNSRKQDSLRMVVEQAVPGYKPPKMNFDPYHNQKIHINRRFNHPM